MIFVCNLAASDQTDDDRRADDECQHKTVRRVPRGKPATNGSACIRKVEECEGRELGDERIFDRHDECGPRDGGCNDSVHVPAVAVISSVSCVFEAPVNSAEERNNLQCQLWILEFYAGTYNGAVSDLQRCNNVKELMSQLGGEEIARSSVLGMVDVKSQVDGRH